MSNNYIVNQQYNSKKCIRTYIVILTTEVEDKILKRFDSLAKRKGGFCRHQDKNPEYIFYTEEDVMTFCIGIDAFFDVLKRKPKDYIAFVALDELCCQQPYPWGIKLYEILRYIIKEKGVEILGNAKLTGILDALGAFDTPASRYVFRSIISDGYAIKLSNLGEWGNEVDSLCNKYAYYTGFSYVNVYAIFQYIAYGLGWIGKPCALKELDNLKQSSNNVIPLTWNKYMDDEQTDLFFQSITKYDYWKETEVLAKMKGLRFHIDNSNHLCISCTLYPYKGLDHAFLRCFIYDYDGDIKEDGTIGILLGWSDTSERYEYYTCKTKPSKIGKIKLFWS